MAVGTASLVAQLNVILGGERTGFDVSRTFSGLTVKHDRMRTCVGATSPTAVTLYDSASDTPTAGDFLAVVLDPDGRQSTEKFVEVEITASSQVTVYRMSTKFPVLMIPARATGTAFGTTAGTISKVRANCPSSTTATTDDVTVRVLLLD